MKLAKLWVVFILVILGQASIGQVQNGAEKFTLNSFKFSKSADHSWGIYATPELIKSLGLSQSQMKAFESSDLIFSKDSKAFLNIGELSSGPTKTDFQTIIDSSGSSYFGLVPDSDLFRLLTPAQKAKLHTWIGQHWDGDESGPAPPRPLPFPRPKTTHGPHLTAPTSP